MPTFLERYIAGECEAVWDELFRMGAAVRQPRHLPEAHAVARETMRRAKENIELLIERLPKIGFQFGYAPDPDECVSVDDSEPVYQLPHPQTVRLLDGFERRVGPMALSLRAWWEMVGSVNLIGSHPQWPHISETDPLFVYPVGVLAGVEEHYQSWLEEPEWERRENPFQIDISPDDLHKGKISGGADYGVRFPSSRADDLFNQGPKTFVQYLRNAFRWGGFPGLEGLHPRNRPARELKFLTQDLLPL